MHSRLITLSAAALIMTSSLVSCGGSASRVREVSKTPPSQNTQTTIPTITVPTEPSEITEPPTEPFSLDITVDTSKALPRSYVIKDFETVLQEPELPTGCEVVSLAQTLNHLGFDIDKVELADNFMPIDYEGAVTMKQAYVGDPKANNGFGCNSPVIVQTADKYFASIDSPCYGADITGHDMNELYYHLTMNRPVIVWITMNLSESHPNYKWTAGNGEEFWFADYQHCATLYGYDLDQGIVYVADPLKGNTTYSEDRFSYIYEIMGKQAVIICGDSSTEGHHVTTDAEKSVVMTTASEKRKQQNNAD